MRVAFYRTASGREPVREWLKQQKAGDLKRIGEEIKTVQYLWPVGFPLVRKLGPDLWELRAQVERRTTRLLFTVQGQTLILLHAFLKQSQRTPRRDLEVARQRLATLKEL